MIAWVFILEGEDVRFRRYLEENGFDTSALGGVSLTEQMKSTTFKLDE